MVDAQDRVMPKYFDRAFTDKIEDAYRDHGVKLALGQKVAGFKTTADAVTITTDKEAITVDLAVLCIGFKPNTGLLAGKVDMLKTAPFLPTITCKLAIQTSLPLVTQQRFTIIRPAKTPTFR